MTVPKRGYKLDATVEQIVEAPAAVVEATLPQGEEPIVPESENSTSQETAELPPVEPKPVPRSQPQTTSKTSTVPKKGIRKRWLATAALIVVGIAVASSYMHVKTSPTPPPSADVEHIATPSYLSLEPRYIHVIMEPSVMNDDLKVGITKKLLDFLKTYKDFRIIYDGPAARWRRMS